MFFTIDPSGGLPIYEQVVRQIKFAVASQVIKAGELVPSVREVARRLAINPNTVARAYRQLQADGVLEAVRGTGLQTTGDALELCLRERLHLIRRRLREVLTEARQSRLDENEIRRLVESELLATEKEKVRS
ncbi:MAG: GntR family transcriptional regulator [Planctomycetota bacterium]|nr:GntR family transcriptional regulator [Planctomycetota bacterium]